MKTFIAIVLLVFMWNESTSSTQFQPQTLSELYANPSIACNSNSSPLVLNESVEAGIIGSPNIYSYAYNENKMRCEWTLRASDDQRIWVKFKRFSLDDECESQLHFFDGENENCTLIDSFCENFKRDFESPNNVLHVVFEATKSFQNPGFQFYFKHVKKPVKCTEKLSCDNLRQCYSQSESCDGNFECKDGKDEENCSYTLPHFESCGKPVISPKLLHLNRIYGGGKSIPGSWPWTASIRLNIAEPEGNMCGGALINHNWVLTAAHCFHDLTPQLWSVHLGRYNRIMDNQYQVTRSIEKIIIHEGFQQVKSGKYYVPINDIALIKLKSSAPFNNPFIQPICVSKLNMSQTHEHLFGYVTGWGSTRGTGFDLLLKQAAVPIITKTDCLRLVPNMTNVINDRVICAGYKDGGDDTCEGDSGGPLMVFDTNTQSWQLIGITSSGSGFGCGKMMAPGLYTDVTAFYLFIFDAISKYK